MDGSGLNEAILESGICTGGSINGVMKEKHYNRALRVHLSVCEALEKLLLERLFSSENGSNIFTDDVKRFPSNLHDDPSKEFWIFPFKTLHLYMFFMLTRSSEEVAGGVHGKTAQFWLSYMNHLELIMRFLMATKKF